jgi:tRNA(Arg) A34 adenosine deaminase TadA
VSQSKQIKHLILAKAFDKRNRQISQSYNLYTKSHPLQAHYASKPGLPEKVYLHAELSCIIKARQPIDHLTVERYGNKGNILLARPCPVCMLAIKEAGIIFVEYTTPGGWTLEYII